MSKAKTAKIGERKGEQPTAGGSFVRQKDGSLKKVADEAEDAPAASPSEPVTETEDSGK